VILAAALTGLCLVPAAADAQTGDDLRAQFQAVIDDLNDNTFRGFHAAIDDNEFVGRAFGTRVIADDAKRAFAAAFPQTLEQMFQSAFPQALTQEEAGGEIIGTVVAFNDEGATASAIVRFDAKGFRYTWHSYDLIRGRGGRVQIVDWYDHYQGSWFSQIIGDTLVRALPSAGPVASVLDLPNPSEGQLFQVGELFKAVRDGNPQRYVQILDGLEKTLREEPFIVHLNFQYWRMIRDPGRLMAAAGELSAAFPGDSRYSLSLAEFYIQARRFDEAIAELDRFEAALGIDDGVVRSLRATAFMALGQFDEAQASAEAAIEAEPTLELGWWTLLRTRTAAENYAGATEVLSELEDRFGHLLVPQKLRRDRFLKVLIDKEEYKEWRAARDAA
jgi:hypothetical protein